MVLFFSGLFAWGAITAHLRFSVQISRVLYSLSWVCRNMMFQDKDLFPLTVQAYFVLYNSF
jgi:hypothetical protein